MWHALQYTVSAPTLPGHPLESDMAELEETSAYVLYFKSKEKLSYPEACPSAKRSLISSAAACASCFVDILGVSNF